MDTSTIILDQIAIWGPKANDAVSVKEVAIGTPYKTKGSQIISRAEKGMVRVAKNYFVGGEPAEKPSILSESQEQISTPILEAENNIEEVIETEQTDETGDTSEEAIYTETNNSQEEGTENNSGELEGTVVVEEDRKVEQIQAVKPKFCLFVRSSRAATEIERKLDVIATKITEEQALAAIGRVNTIGPMSFEYTNFNLEEID